MILFHIGILGVGSTAEFNPKKFAPGILGSSLHYETDTLPILVTFQIMNEDEYQFDTEITCGTDFATNSGMTVDPTEWQLVFPDYGTGSTGCRVGMSDWLSDSHFNKPLDALEPSLFNEDGHAETRAIMDLLCWNENSPMAAADYPSTGFVRSMPASFHVPTRRWTRQWI